MTCRTLSSCRLYSWMRLTWLSKMRVGVDGLPGGRLQPVGELRPWPPRLACRKPSRNAGVVGQRVASSASLAKIGDPAVADRVGDERDRSGLARSSQRRGVTPLVLLLKRSGNISARSRHCRLAQQLGVDAGDAVGAVRADDRQIGHADLVLRALLDQADARDAAVVAGKARAHVVEEAAVDLVDDLELSRQHLLEAATPAMSRAPRASACGWCRPGSACVRSHASSQPQLRLVEQDPHQLGTASVGWVSLSWMATLSGSWLQSSLPRRKRRTMSASEQATRKYSWAKRSSCPVAVESSG